MTVLVLCLAAVGVVAGLASVLVVLVMEALQDRIGRLAPVAQARLYLLAAFTPMLSAVVMLTAALAPSFGWLADHCGPGDHPHAHPHVCLEHGGAILPGPMLFGVALLLAIRIAYFALQRCAALWMSLRVRRTLDRTCRFDAQAGWAELPVDEAQAFVLGLFGARLYASRALLSGAHQEHWAPVLAHERAHLKRRDPLRRFLAGLGLAFHLPWLASVVDRRLGRAQEMAADEAAALVVGSRERVASALVAVARSRSPLPATAYAFSASDVESRVVQLLDHRRREDRPSTSTLVLMILLAVLVSAASADAVHHGVEILLGLLGG